MQKHVFEAARICTHFNLPFPKDEGQEEKKIFFSKENQQEETSLSPFQYEALIAASPYFKIVFLGKSSEKKDVILSDVDKEEFQNIFTDLIQRTVSLRNLEESLKYIEIASYYQIILF